MGRLKTFRKYIIWISLFYLFTMFCTYIGLNATYKNINTSNSNVPEGVNIEVAQSTKVNGRIYGKVKSTKENDLNNKYLKIDIFDKKGRLSGTKFLKLENLTQDEEKKFAVNFIAEDINNYSIKILDDIEETREQEREAISLFGDKFTSEEIKIYSIFTLLLYAFLCG